MVAEGCGNNRLINMDTKYSFKDDPEEYWKMREERKKTRGEEIMSDWEKNHPNEVYGGNTFNFGDNE